MKILFVLTLLWQNLSVTVLAQQDGDLDCSFRRDIALRSNGNILFRHVTNPVAGTLTVELVYEGLAWLGLGFSSNGRMLGSLAVIGLPNEDVTAKYNLGAYSISGVLQVASSQQTLTDSSITQNATHTVLKFTKLLAEDGELELRADGRHNFIYAVGGNNALSSRHIARGDFTIDLQPCRVVGQEQDNATGEEAAPIFSGGSSGNDGPNRQLWMAHGLLMALAWGIFVPLAVGSSRLRDLLGFAPGLWFKIHQGLNMLAVLCTIVGFAIAVHAINEEDGKDAKHFTEIPHRKVGLAITLLAVIQAMVGLFRPHPPKAAAVAANLTKAKDLENSDSIGDTNNSSFIPKDKDVSSEVEAADDDDDQQEQHPTKSKLRSAWEWKHRILGMSLLALSWYNCNSGLERFALLFGEEYDKTAAFWGFTAGLTGLIIVLDVAQRARRGRASK
jgi:hypothetical protein